MSGTEKYERPLHERLPQHRPSRDLWPGIDKNLAAGGATSLEKRLPRHKPARNLWPAISRKIPAPWYSLRSNYMRGFLAALMVMILLLLWPGLFENDDTTVRPHPENPVPERLNKTDISESKSVASAGKSVNNRIVEPVKETATGTGQEVAGNSVPSESKIEKVTEPEDKAAESISSSGSKLNRETGAAIPGSGYDPGSVGSLHPLNPVSFIGRSGKYSEHDGHPVFEPRGRHDLNLEKEVSFEAGAFFQPSAIRNISTLNEDWYCSPGAGVSLGMVHRQFIMETGLSLSRVEFEDKIEIDYFAFIYLGTVISTNAREEEFVNNQGDTITQVVYSIDLVDVYDSTFVEDEKNDIVKLSTATIPITVGYRFADRGNYFLDVKTGLDLMIITGRVIPGNPTPTENIKVTDVRNSLARKYSVKWKYHISLGAGLRFSERWSLYAEPTLWWYPEGIRSHESRELKNPFEAGIRLGLKWEF